ncbi:MAG: peptidoglycan D,D-transpeptidase FtsI family protein [Gammaproteobacteria bacterium]
MTPRNFSPAPPHLAAWRKYAFFGCIILLFFGIVCGGMMRVWHFAGLAKEEARVRHIYKKEIFAHRGDIVDAAGLPLAASADVYDVRADMVELAGNGAKRRARLQKLIPELAEILNISPEVLAEKLSGGGRAVLLKKSLSPARARRLAEFRSRHEIRGLRAEYHSKRYYPQKEYAASVVGYTNLGGTGKSGAEFAYHNALHEENGDNRGMRARTGRRIVSAESRPPKDGENITLSIDSRLQFYAYEALREAAARHNARAGAAAVMDSRTGEILALASYPGFNPNNISRGDSDKNRALTDSVEPGSLAKPFIVALALKHGAARPGEIFPAHLPRKMGGVLVRDEHIREPVNLAGVLQKSSNIGAAMLARRLGAEKVWDLYRRLEFGGGKVLGMPGEASGTLRPHKEWRESGLVTHAYGYGFSATLLQILAGYSVFAADGARVSPRLKKTELPPYRDRVLPAETARRVRVMMEAVTRPGGTATAAAIGGYRIAGKTGTAKKTENGKYGSGKYRAFFVGIAPASAPRYIAAVMIDEPRQNGYTGGATAAPVFHEIMRRALRLNAVPPDDFPAQKLPAQPESREARTNDSPADSPAEDAATVGEAENV